MLVLAPVTRRFLNTALGAFIVQISDKSVALKSSPGCSTLNVGAKLWKQKGFLSYTFQQLPLTCLGFSEMEGDSSPGKRFTNFDLWNHGRWLWRIVFRKIYAHRTPNSPRVRFLKDTSSSWNRVTVMKNQRARCEPLFIRFITQTCWLQVISRQVIYRKSRDVINMIMHRNFPCSSLPGL